MRTIFACLLTVWFAMPSQAQYAVSESEFMTPLLLNKAQLNARQQQMVENIQRNTHYTQLHYVQMGNLAKSQKKGVLTFTIPGQKKPVSFQVTQVEAQSEDTYSWYGTLLNGVGSAVLLSEKGTIYGSFQVEGQMYRLYGLDKRVSALLTVDEKSFGKAICPHIDPEPEANRKAVEAIPTHSSQRITSCYNPVRILILVTPAARREDPAIEQTARTGVAQFNAAITNSGITSSAKLELAGVVEYNFVEDFNLGWENRMRFEISRVANNPVAQQLRNHYQADIVLMLTATGYDVGDLSTGEVIGHIFGTVQAVDSNWEGDAYGLVEASAVGSTITFPHEIGHLFGGRHEDDNSGASYAHGGYFERRRFIGVFPYRYATIMHTYKYPTNQFVSRPLHFSNPMVQINGAASGDYQRYNVARRINETASRMANFRPSVGTLRTDILGRGIADREGDYTYEASLSCGQAPYTYQWAYSYDGLTYIDESSATQDTYTFYCYPGDVYDYYLRLTVTSTDGQTAQAFQLIQVNVGMYADPFGGRKAAVGTSADKPLPILEEVIPNPVATEAQISFALPSDNPLTLEVFNSIGQRVHTVSKGHYTKGYYTEAFSVDYFPNGVYFYRLTTPSFSQTKRFVVLR